MSPQMDNRKRNLLLESGQAHLAKKEYRLALEDFEKVIELAAVGRQMGRVRGVLSVLDQYFVTCRKINEPELAFKYIEDYEKLLVPCNEADRAAGFFEVGLLYMKSIPKGLTQSDSRDKVPNGERHFELAANYFQKGLDAIAAGLWNPVERTRTRTSGFFALKSLGLQHLGILRFREGRHDHSISKLRSAIETHKLLGKNDGWKDWSIYIPYKCHKYLCLNYLKVGTHVLTLALQEARDAVKMADKIKDVICQAKARDLVAEVHFRRAEAEEGVNELAAALQLLQGMSDYTENRVVNDIKHKYQAALEVLEVEAFEMTQKLADEKRASIDSFGKNEEVVLPLNDGNAFQEPEFEEHTHLQYDNDNVDRESDVASGDPFIISSWSLANNALNTSVDNSVDHHPIRRISASETEPVRQEDQEYEQHDQINQDNRESSQLKRRRVDHAGGVAGPSNYNDNSNCVSLNSTGFVKMPVKMESPEPELQVIFSSFERLPGNIHNKTGSIPRIAETSLERIRCLRVDLKFKDICIVIPLKPEDLRKDVKWLRDEVESRFRHMDEIGTGETIKYLTTKDKGVLCDKDILEDLMDETKSKMVAVVSRRELSV